MSQPEVVIVVPCYNEAARLPKQHFSAFADHAPEYNFLFVDDGSTDNTYEVLNSFAQERPERFKVLRLEKNGGKAEAVRRGFLETMKSEVPFIGFWDADLATPLRLLPDFLRVFHDRPRAEIILGSRIKLLGSDIRRRAIRHYLGRVFATFASVTLNLGVYDTQCGAKVFRVTDTLKDIFSKPFKSRWIFDVEILARFLKRRHADRNHVNVLIHELPLAAWYDIAGSKVKPADFFKAFFELMTIFMDNR